MNTVHITGSFVHNPVMKFSKTGVPYLPFMIANDRKENMRKTDFIPCLALGKMAELICGNAQRGDMVAVTGKLQTSSYVDKLGQRRAGFQVVITEIDFYKQIRVKADIKNEWDSIADLDFSDKEEY